MALSMTREAFVCAYILVHQTGLADTAVSKDDNLSKHIESESLIV
jgi:hypothetical protein